MSVIGDDTTTGSVTQQTKEQINTKTSETLTKSTASPGTTATTKISKTETTIAEKITTSIIGTRTAEATETGTQTVTTLTAAATETTASTATKIKTTRTSTTATPIYTTKTPERIEYSFIIRFKNLTLTDEMLNTTSNDYQEIRKSLKDIINNTLTNFTIYEIKINELTNGSIIARTLITTNYTTRYDEIVTALNQNENIEVVIRTTTKIYTTSTTYPTSPLPVEKSEMKVTFKQFNWTSALEDKNSTEYKTMAEDIKNLLMKLLKNLNVKEVIILRLRQGSVEADTEIIYLKGTDTNSIVNELQKDPNIKAEIVNTLVTTTSSPSKPLKDWTIAVIVVCAVLVSLLIVLVAVSLINRRKNRGHVSFHHVEMDKMEDNASLTGGNRNVGYVVD